ncbi:unnamed protein product [Tilletia controversa]|nr:unnamed protein product [Tilletia controversa]
MPSGADGAAAAASSSSRSTAANNDREAFNSALRSRAPNNAYISHLKIQEVDADSPSRPKSRYLITAVDRDTGRVTLNKARRNSNMTYSIGKDWDLNLLQQVEVHTPTSFTVTLARPYSYTSDRPNEQEAFLQMIVNVYRRYTGDSVGPILINLTVQASASRSAPSKSVASSSNASASNVSSSNDSSQDEPPGRKSVSSVHSNSSSQGQSLKPTLSIPVPSFSTSASSPTTPTAESMSFASPFGASPAASPVPGSKRREKERGAGFGGEEPILRKSASSSRLQASRSPQLPIPPPPQANPTSPSRKPSVASFGNPPDSTDEDDDPYGGVVLGDATPTPPSAPFTTPSKPSISSSSRESPTFTRTYTDPTALPSPKSRNGSTNTLRRMGSSPHIPNGVPIPRRSESIPDLARAAGRRPGTAGSQGTDGGRSSSRAERGASSARSPSTGADVSGQAFELPKSVPEESIPAVPSVPSITSIPSIPSIPSITETAAVPDHPIAPRPHPPKPITRTLSKMLPLDGGEDDDDDEDEDPTLAYVEEMLEGFEWRPMIGEEVLGAGFGKRRRLAKRNDAMFGGNAAASAGTADVIEARLLKELSALEEANIHGMVQSDERVGLVIKHMDDALAQLDVMDGMIMRFKMSLNGRDEDINHIESQNGALQIHTSNQQKLAAEIERLLDTIHVDEGSIYTLKHASLESRGGIEELERAAGELYKSIVQATSTTGENVSAATERLDEYRTLSERFCKRLFDHVNLTLTAETSSYLSDPARQNALSPSRHPGPSLQNHANLEELLGRYCGLVLYMKETSPAYFARLCSVYHASVGECWRREMTVFFSGWKKRIKRGSGDDYGFEVGDSSGVQGLEGPKSPYERKGSSDFGRAATIRKVVKGDKSKHVKAQDEGDLTATEVFQRVVDSLTPLLQGEQTFISDFLQINDSNVTFADYCDMEPYFRRRAAQLFGFGTPTTTQGGGPTRELKVALEMIFGFLGPEWDSLADHAVHMDKSQIIPTLAMLDRAITDAEDSGSDFIARTLFRVHTRLSSVLEKIEDEQQADGANGVGGPNSSMTSTQGKAAGEKEKEKEKEKKKKRVANLLRKHR